jgi:hypothetical protein
MTLLLHWGGGMTLLREMRCFSSSSSSSPILSPRPSPSTILSPDRFHKGLLSEGAEGLLVWNCWILLYVAITPSPLKSRIQLCLKNVKFIRRSMLETTLSSPVMGIEEVPVPRVRSYRSRNTVSTLTVNLESIRY